jgi:hypothetical protein
LHVFPLGSLERFVARAGVLSLDELRKALESSGLTDEQIEQLHSQLSINHGGTVIPTPGMPHLTATLQVTEEAFVAGFVDIYCAAHPSPEWVNNLPEGAFSEFECRGVVIEDGEHRAVSLQQMEALATLLQRVLAVCQLMDDNQYSTTNGQPITWSMANMCVLLLCGPGVGRSLGWAAGTTYVTRL